MELTPAEEAARVERLAQNAHIASVLRDFCQHPGFKILVDMIEEKVADVRKEWLSAKTAEECWALKLKAEPWKEIQDFLKAKILHGDASSLALRSTRDSKE